MMSPQVLLVSFALASTLARVTLLRGRAAPVAAPASVMAIGIFGLAAMQHIPALSRDLSAPLAVLLLVLWGHLAVSFIAAALTGTLRTSLQRPVDRFAVGTWVAGTAVVARMIAVAVPGWYALAAFLAALGGMLWLWFMTLAAGSYRVISASGAGHRANGLVLLTTVSTQSLVILTIGLFPDVPVLRRIALPLVLFGYALYAIGAVLILRRYLGQKGWRLADDWENPNCILHGAMSITGLAAVTSGALPFAVCYATWLYAACMFMLVETAEVARLLQRRRLYGWRRGLGTYDVSQWSRNFTFGMFYAFTLAFAEAFKPDALPPALAAAQAAVLAWGPYVVLGLLAAELALLTPALGRRVK
jgi:hypothetical protein